MKTRKEIVSILKQVIDNPVCWKWSSYRIDLKLYLRHSHKKDDELVKLVKSLKEKLLILKHEVGKMAIEDILECEQLVDKPKLGLGKKLFITGATLYHALFGFGGTDVHTPEQAQTQYSGYHQTADSSYLEQAKQAMLGGVETANAYQVQKSNRTELPDTTGWKKLPDVEYDADSRIPGKETIYSGFERNGQLLIIARLRGKSNPYGFWSINKSTGAVSDTYMDRDNDKVFESYIPSGAGNLGLDLKAWGCN